MAHEDDDRSARGFVSSGEKRALEAGTPIHVFIEQALRRGLGLPDGVEAVKPVRRPIRWVTAKGELPAGLDLSNRVAMYSWFREET